MKGFLKRAMCMTLAVILSLIACVSCSKSENSNEENEEKQTEAVEEEISRSDWISLLVQKKGWELNEREVQNFSIDDCYYGDTKKDARCVFVEIAKGYGVLPPEDDTDKNNDMPLFHPNEPATREFAAYTAVRAMGYYFGTADDTFDCADFDELLYPEETAIAVEEHFLSLDDSNRFNPKKPMSSSDIESIFKAMDEIDESVKPKQKETNDNSDNNDNTNNTEDVQYQNNVIKDEISSVTDYKVEEISEDHYKITTPKTEAINVIKEGSVVIFPPNNEHITGVVAKIISINSEKEDEVVFDCKEPELEEVFSSIDISFDSSDTSFNVEDMQLGEGVEFIPYD